MYDYFELLEQNIRAKDWSKKDFTGFRNAKFALLKKIAKVFDDNEVKWFIDCGTLLGIYRDGKLIDTDNDVDIAVRAEDIDDKFFAGIDVLVDDDALMVSRPCHAGWKEQYAEGYLEPDERSYRITSKERYNDKAIFADLNVWFPHKDCYFAWGGDLYRHKAENLKSFSTIVYKGLNLRIPRKTEDYLATIYTENWKTPDSSWREGNNSGEYWFKWTDGYKKELSGYKLKIKK